MKLAVIAIALVALSVVVTGLLPHTGIPMEGFHHHKKGGGLKLVEAFHNLNFTSPTNLIFGANSNYENMVYVSEQSGIIYTFEINNDDDDRVGGDSVPLKTLNPQIFLDLSEILPNYDQLDLYGLAFNPKFPDSPYFYVYYVYHEPSSLFINSILSRFRVYPDDPNRADISSEDQLIALVQPRGSHIGGSLFFAEWDECLYLSLGDGGRSSHDPFNSAQNPNSFFGKILRLSVDQPEGYSVPRDNPFVSGGALSEIYALGFRNPWRCSTDEITQTILCGDVGDAYWEEVNLILSGKNYGWNLMEGPNCVYDNHCHKYKYEMPLFYYPHPSMHVESNFNGSSIVGGNIYRGEKIPWLTGSYVFGDSLGHKLGAVFNNNWELKSCELMGPEDIEENIIGFGVDNEKELYVLFEGNYPIMKMKNSKKHDDDTIAPPGEV